MILIKKLFLFAAIAAACLTANSCDKEEATPSVPKAESLDDFQGHTIALQTGSTQDLYFDKWEGIKVLRLNSTPECFSALSNGLADYCTVDAATLLAATASFPGLDPCFEFSTGYADICFGLKRDDTELCEKINAYIAKLRADGSYDAIIEKWRHPESPEAVMPDYILEAENTGTPIMIGTASFLPFEFFKGNEWVGLEMEILRGFCAENGLKPIIKDFDFAGLIAALASGKIDMIAACMTRTDEREKQVLFSDPIFRAETICLRYVAPGGAKKKNIIERAKDSFYKNVIQEDRWKMLLQGLKETVIISFFAILFGILVGVLICWMRMSRFKVFSLTAETLVDIIRGVPILVFLMIMFYIVFASSSITARWVAIIAFAINFGAYTSEMFRTGIMGVEKGQTEAGLAMGFGRFGTFINFIAPQAAKNIIPVFKGEAVSLIKNTSIVGYIAIQDLTKISDVIRSRTFDAFFPLIIISIIYFILAWMLGKFLDRIASKLK